MWERATITDAGSNLLASWVTGATLNLTRAACGTGTSGSEETLYQLTTLIDERLPMSIIDMTKEDKSVILKLQATAADTKFQMQQIAVFANVNDGPTVMLAIFEDDVGISIPEKSSTQEFLYNFYATIMINNQGKINVTIDTSVMVSMESMMEALAKKENLIDAVGLLVRDEDGTIRSATSDDLSGAGGTGAFYGSSDSIASDPSKDVLADGMEDLFPGAMLITQFRYGNSATNPTMIVNDLPETAIVSRGSSTLLPTDYWSPGDYVLFMYDGTRWVDLLKFGTYIPMEQKGTAGGVATLDEEGKVPSSQLRGGFVVQDTAPADTSLLWVNQQVLKYYDTATKTWKVVLPVWG